MSNSLYLDSGYLNIEYILNYNLPFNWIVGGRGTGKTYGALKYALESDKRFIFMRRTQTQIDLIVNQDFNPFESINIDLGVDIGCYTINKYNKGFYREEYDKDEDCYKKVGEPIGFGMALSTISNLRGFDASKVSLLIFDEFISELHERPIKNEADAFLNAYETMNRNRELKGEDPIQVLFLANSNNIANPLFLKLNLVQQAGKLINRSVEFAALPKRESTMTILLNSKISEAKRETVLYKLAKGTSFNKMSIGNEFVYNNAYNVEHRSLIEYNPLIKFKEITIYKHKSRKEYYISEFCNGAPKREYGNTVAEHKNFLTNERWIAKAYIGGLIYFETYTCQVLLEEYLKKPG